MSIELLKDNPTEAERALILETIEASTRRGADMVRQVLSFARGVEGERTAIDIARLLRDAEKIVRDTFMKAIAVETAMATTLAPVLGDLTQLHQVVINLCLNARDAMPDGGTLRLMAHMEHLNAHGVALNPGAREGLYVAVRVTDTGTGISPEVMDRIFDPFFTSKPTGQGTGLGLSTSAAIVKSHGGFMRVESEVGRGSTFTVYLPAQAGLPMPAPGASAPSLARGSGELILVVDDEEPLLRMTSLVLESFGYRVLLAANGFEAIAQFDSNREAVKLVLTDMTMPEMDGAAVIKRLREIDPRVRIIAASGLTVTDEQVAGVSLFLPKPYNADTLLKAVTGVLRRQI
jgi:CheY-like chemotaxis protein